MENQSHFDDYPEKGKSLIDIASRGGREYKTGGSLSGGFSLKLLIALLQQWYYSLDYWKELERERECERGKIDFCWRDRRHIQR